ncbi:MAG TPA: 50S ribosomal protein L10 [Nitrososphaeraceae archaeon]|nr:50S ribosomal protein L10 [Nitrososphaeraceae archaeon]
MAQNASVASRQRTSYPRKKRLMYQQLQKLPREFSVIALSKMTKIRATQLMKIRKKFREDIKITVIKNKVAKRAFENTKDIAGLDTLSERLEGQIALMFTNINPFKLNSILSQNKVFLPAKGGDTASKEIIIPAGNTSITPGPVLSEFKEANVPTKIDQGTIWVSRDTVVAKPGQTISQKLASLMSKLDIKPIEAGISVIFAISDGFVFKDSDLNINLTEYKHELIKCFQEAIALATESAYVTEVTINPLITRAHKHAIALSYMSQYLSTETLEHLLLPEAELHAKLLSAHLTQKGYTAVV